MRVLYIVPSMRHAEGCAFARRPGVLVVSAGIDRPLYKAIAGYQLRAIVVHPDAHLRARDWFYLQSCYPCYPASYSRTIDWRVGEGDSIHTEDLFAENLEH